MPTIGPYGASIAPPSRPSPPGGSWTGREPARYKTKSSAAHLARFHVLIYVLREGGIGAKAAVGCETLRMDENPTHHKNDSSDRGVTAKYVKRKRGGLSPPLSFRV